MSTEGLRACLRTAALSEKAIEFLGNNKVRIVVSCDSDEKSV